MFPSKNLLLFIKTVLYNWEDRIRDELAAKYLPDQKLLFLEKVGIYAGYTADASELYTEIEKKSYHENDQALQAVLSQLQGATNQLVEALKALDAFVTDMGLAAEVIAIANNAVVRIREIDDL